MIMMTAKVDKKHILVFLAAAAAVLAMICLVFGHSETDPQDQPVSLETNEARVQYLAQCGCTVASNPVQTQEVRIPAESNEVLDRYNALQLTQGFDLMKYAGKTVTRYVYEVQDDAAAEPVYATLLVYKDRLVGADLTDTAAGGTIRSLTR